MVFLKVVLVGLASPRGLTVQCFPQEYFSPTPPFHFRCVGPYVFPPHPVSFPFRVSLQHPLVSSLVSRGNSVEISWFGPKISQIGKIPGILRVYLENPGYTWKIPG